MPKEKILVVDDNLTNVKFIETFLSKEGYSVSKAFNGEEALYEIEKTQFDLIITDIIMPRVNGYELCEKVKTDKNTKEIPIIVITALSETEDKVKALELGADEFISKPFNSVELVARVKSLLRERKYYRQIVKQNSIYEEELNIAKKLQESILPRNDPQLEKVVFASKYIPAYYIGGDYYSYNVLADNKIGIFISDVMGHGVISSLVTMLLKSNFDNLSQHYHKPSELLEALNRKIYDAISDSMIYSTAVYAILDTDNLELTYSFAGHPPFYKVSEKGEIASFKSSGGVIGLFNQTDFEDECIKLNKGDYVIFYTDGLTEVTDKKGIEFGDEMFQEEIKNAHNFSHPKDFIEHLIESIRLYSGKKDFEDDINLIVFKCI